jgi:hypothetical protein
LQGFHAFSFFEAPWPFQVWPRAARDSQCETSSDRGNLACAGNQARGAVRAA